MNYIEPTLDTVLIHLDNLAPDAKPLWGTMNATRMVEHITDTLHLAMGEIPNINLEIPEEKVVKAQGFLTTEYPLPRDYQAVFAKPETPLRHEELSDAIDELTDVWIKFEDFFERQPEMTTLHPSFGMLSFDQWLRLHQKHLTHHFQQFGLIPE